MTKPVVKCSVPDCWQPASGPSALCNACKSWWRRIRYKSASEFAQYLRKQRRMQGRIGVYGKPAGKER